jgi:hypothetical protein
LPSHRARRRLFSHVAFATLSLLLACSSTDPAPGDPSGAAGGGTSAQAGSSSGGGTSGGGGASGANLTGGASGKSGATSTGGKSDGGGTAAAGADTSAGAGDGGDSGSGGDYWRPKAGATWQWQLSEEVGTPLNVQVYDIDWEADRATVDALHARGIKVICYVSVGSWEDYRPDAGDFPAAVIGKDYDGWPGEKYVDIRSDAVRAIMSARFDVCRDKGFDAIEPDNQDVFELGQDSGFPLTRADGVAYARWLADQAHSRGLSIGQKNAPGITNDLVASYDWALTESCYSDDDWCGDVKAYVDADKPVFMCEYESASFEDACRAWQPRGYSPILKSLDLDAPITSCP